MKRLTRQPAPLSRSMASIKSGVVSGEVEAALGGDLFPAFRHQRRLEGCESAGQAHDLRARGQLEVEDGADRAGQAFEVGVLHVAPVFPQVGRNAIGASSFAERGGRDRVRFVGLARFAQGRDVIDVDVKTHDS